MSRRLSGGCSPLRDKRRQSDAKWRASVATCYDALKYVVPNVKHLSKKKISKALILQECEKHIQDLEDTISCLLHVECKNRGQIALWKEGDNWSECSMEKLHADFAEKQRRVFHTSSHGRRCYNLLQDIKEEVFNMQADSKQMVFIREDSLSFLDESEHQSDTSALSIFQFPVENVNEITISEDSATTEGHLQTTGLSISNSTDCLNIDITENCLSSVPDSCVSKEDNVQVRQQPHSHQRLFKQDNTDLLVGLNDDGKNADTLTLVPCDPVYLLSSDSIRSEEKHQIVQCVVSSAATSSISLAVDVITDKNSSTDMSHDVGDKYKLKMEKLADSLYILSNEREYTCLLTTLEAEKEQEVPSLETPTNTTTKIKRPRLTSQDSDADCLTSSSMAFTGNSKESIWFSYDVLKENSGMAENRISNSCGSHSVRLKTSAQTSNANSSSSISHLSMPIIKVETDDSTTAVGNHNPLLNSLDTPKHDLGMPLFCWSENTGFIKQPLKYGCARKRLNFNCPSYSGWSQTFSHLLSPERTVQTSPVLKGFTPIKLPNDLALNYDQDNPLESLSSPWNSPFNSQTVPQGYIDNSSSLGDLDDSLLCLETFDTLDSLGYEVTPAQSQNSDKLQQPDELQKAKVSALLTETDNRMKPKCRRRLERFYDHLDPTKDDISLSDDSHVVPQVNFTFWTSTSPFHSSQLASHPVTDQEDNLLCLETLDTLEWDAAISTEV